MLGFLKLLFLDKRARQALRPAMRAAAPARPEGKSPPAKEKERDPATALAEAEERMKRLPPEKAQLIRTARLIHRARQSALGELSDEDRRKLQEIAEKAFLGPGRSG